MVVTAVISPIISKIEERKFMSLRFFISINGNQIGLLIKQASDFLSLAFAEVSVHTVLTQLEQFVIKDKKRLKQMQIESRFLKNSRENSQSQND